MFLGEYEMSSLKHQYEGLVPGKTLDIPELIKVGVFSQLETMGIMGEQVNLQKQLTRTWGFSHYSPSVWVTSIYELLLFNVIFQTLC